MALRRGILVLTSALLGLLQAAALDQSRCASTCHELNCDNANINYGKFCGIGHGGCKGEKPCDAVDACCRKHDDCVENAGLLGANPCHEKFIACLNRVEKSGKKGFSAKCPYEMVIPTMRNGIQLAMALTSMFGGPGLDSRQEMEL